MPQSRITRRSLLALAAAVIPATSFAATPPARRLEVYRDPGCGCCEVWVEHMRKAGFEVAIADDADRGARRAALGIPEALASCHTGVVGGIAIEGHVPPAEVVRLLTEKPAGVIALAVAGMPLGSPGMETNGPSDPYEVIAVRKDGSTAVFARY